MTQRVVVGASAVVFGLLAVMVHLLVAVHDNSSPIALDSPSRLTLDFADSAVQDEEALRALRTWDADAGTGLVRQAADLDGDLRGKIFIAVNKESDLPSIVEWYGDEPTSRVVGPEALSHTTASGRYFATGDPAGLPTLIAEAERHGVRVERDDGTIKEGLQGLYRIQSLALAFLTGCVLLATLVLYWLAVKSRSRALRVLGGSSVGRVQVHDMGRLLLLATGSWLAVAAASTVGIGLWKGWSYAPLFAAYLTALGGLMLAVVSVAALVMSRISVPSPQLIARRQPATVGVRRAAGALKAITFVLVLSTVGPAWLALHQAVTSAEQLSRWQQLADQTRLIFPSAGESDYQRLMPPFGDLVHEVEDNDGAVALSAVFASEESHAYRWASESLGDRWSGFALVNERWLDLVLTETDSTRLVEVPPNEVPQSFYGAFEPQLEIWQRQDVPVAQTLREFEYYTPEDGPVPLVGSGGDLVHLDDVLVIVVPSVWETFNDSFLISSASGAELLFTGLDSTQLRLEEHELARDIKVQYAAEAGILAAQFAANEAWMSIASMIGLAVALVVAAAISAYLMALLQARNDFARRLAGQHWMRVLQRRMALDAALAVLLATAVAALQPTDHLLPVTLTALAAVAVSPMMHVFAAGRGFADMRARRL